MLQTRTQKILGGSGGKLPQPRARLASLRFLAAVISTLGLWTASLQPAPAQAKPEGSVRGAAPGTEEEQLRERLRDYVARTAALVPLKDVEIAAIGAPDSHGIRKVEVRLNNSRPPVTNLFYITADGGEVLRGPVEELSSDPWSGMRDRLASLAADAPATGPADAQVTLIEFGDFECPFCAQLNSELEQLRAAYPKSLRWIFKNFPLARIHPWAQDAAASAECVAAQSIPQFWTYQHLVFQHQQEIDARSADRQLRAFALQSGISAQAYDRCTQSPETARRVQARIADGEALGITATPTLFLNGRKISGAVSLDSLKVVIEDEIALTSRQAARKAR